MPIDRRQFLRVTGALAVVAALPAASASASDLELQPPGTYQISGRVRLHEPLVSISGITNAQQISWSPGSLSTPVATFSSFEHFDQPWRMPPIQVTGGQLEAVRVMPLVFA